MGSSLVDYAPSLLLVAAGAVLLAVGVAVGVRARRLRHSAIALALAAITPVLLIMSLTIMPSTPDGPAPSVDDDVDYVPAHHSW